MRVTIEVSSFHLELVFTVYHLLLTYATTQKAGMGTASVPNRGPVCLFFTFLRVLLVHWE